MPIPFLYALLCSASLSSNLVKESALIPVPIQQVQIDDSFWSPKLKVWREVTFPDCFAKFEKDGAITNFDQIANGSMGEHGGPPWYDG